MARKTTTPDYTGVRRGETSINDVPIRIEHQMPETRILFCDQF